MEILLDISYNKLSPFCRKKLAYLLVIVPDRSNSWVSSSPFSSHEESRAYSRQFYRINLLYVSLALAANFFDHSAIGMIKFEITFHRFWEEWVAEIIYRLAKD